MAVKLLERPIHLLTWLCVVISCCPFRFNVTEHMLMCVSFWEVPVLCRICLLVILVPQLILNHVRDSRSNWNEISFAYPEQLTEAQKLFFSRWNRTVGVNCKFGAHVELKIAPQYLQEQESRQWFTLGEYMNGSKNQHLTEWSAYFLSIINVELMHLREIFKLCTICKLSSWTQRTEII